MSAPHLLQAHDAQDLAVAIDALARGELVAIPTETVYGLAALGLSAPAVAQIFVAKERPSNNPLILHVHDVEAARALVTQWPEDAEILARAFWPGPLTLVLPRAACVPDLVTASGPSVAIRVPAHPITQAVLRALDAPLAAPSANRYTHTSPTQASHVVSSLGERVGFVLDAGPTQVGLESTVVSLLGPHPEILRPGMITLEDLRAVLPSTQLSSQEIVEGEIAVSPGLARKHYAPRARVVVIPQGASPSDTAPGAALLTYGAAVDTWSGLHEGLPDDPQGYAASLYAALHRLDAQGARVIYIWSLPEEGEAWRALRDRLRRARS